VSEDNGRAPVLPASLSRLRWRLTAWYVGTFFAILLLIGVGMFATITRRFDRDLDASLGDASKELIRVVRARTNDATPSIDSIHDFRIPDRRLLLLDTLGGWVAGDRPESWISTLARDAAQTPVHRHWAEGERLLRAYAEPFTLASGQRFVAVAVADEIELEDKYASLIAAFGAAALAGLLLVALGGWLLARESTEPVERAITHMRRFMADAAHELRTPLTVVRSRAEVALQRSRDADEYTGALRNIERETAQLGRIVEDLLMLARADAGERPIERRRVFLDDVALDAADAARVIADRRSVRLEVDEFEESPVDGDASLLRQLTIILLDNAIKFTDAGGVVRLSIRRAGTGSVLSVSDTGAGIPSDQLPHVFERFYRGDPARTRTGGNGASQGAGLGLSIAQWIAIEHGATLSIASSPGAGTRVTVEFPPPILSPSAVLSSS
jgi:signal transduction histidine kinase